LLFLHKYTVFCEVVKHGIVVTAQRANFLSGTSKGSPPSSRALISLQ
jgi:hypothetical protein